MQVPQSSWIRGKTPLGHASPGKEVKVPTHNTAIADTAEFSLHLPFRAKATPRAYHNQMGRFHLPLPLRVPCVTCHLEHSSPHISSHPAGPLILPVLHP